MFNFTNLISIWSTPQIPLQRYNKKCTYASKARKYLAKKIDVYLIRYSVLAQARLKAKYWIADDKVQTDFC